VKLNSGIAVAFALSLAMAGLAGCENEGPMERAGEKIDNAAEEAGDKMEDAGDKLEDKARDAKD
jgi:hypothetical protein